MINIIKRLGTYSAMKEATVQFNSIVFRVVAGFMAGAPLEIIALITSIEATINFLAEVPFGKLADRYGRIPIALLGHLSVIIGLSAGYFALVFLNSNPQLSYFLFICHGVFIGFTKPMISGSVEAFYQDALENSNESTNQDDLSMTLSKKYGKYLTTIFILASFLTLYITHQTIGAHHSYLVGIFLWAYTAYTLNRDYKTIGDQHNPSKSKTKTVLSNMLMNKRVMLSMFYSMTSYLIIFVIMGYFIVSLGRSFEGNQRWILIIAFMVSSLGLGWILKSFLLPRLIKSLKEKNYISLFYFLLIPLSYLISLGLKSESLYVSLISVVILGLVIILSYSAIIAVSKNMLMAETNKKDLALALSIQSMPSYLVVAIVSFIFSYKHNGTPTPSGLLLIVCGLSFASLLIHLSIYQNKEVK